MIKFSREGNDNPCGYDIGHIEISIKNIIISSHQPFRSFMVYVSAIELLYFLRLNMLGDDVEKVFHFTSSNFYLTFKFSHNEMSAIDNKTNSKVIQEKWLYMQEFVSATAKLLKENPLPTNDPVFNDLTESINDAVGFIQKYQ